MLFIASAWLGNSKFKVKLVYNPPSPPKKWEVENIFLMRHQYLGGNEQLGLPSSGGSFPPWGKQPGSWELATSGRADWWCPIRGPHLKRSGPGDTGDRLLGDVSSSRPHWEVGAQWFPDRFISL